MNHRIYPYLKLHSYRIIRILASATGLMIVSLLTGCTDDLEPIFPTSGELITFSVSFNDDWQSHPNSRSEVRPEAIGNDTVYSMLPNDCHDQLYLHTRTEINRSDLFKNCHNKSRGSLMTTMSDYDSFGLFSSIYDGDWVDEYGVNYMFNTQCRHISDNSFAPVEQYFWPGLNRNIRFWGYAPYNHSAISISSSEEKDEPTITYTVPQNNKEQIDLVSVSSNGTSV